MLSSRSWADYPLNYRASEMETLGGWIELGTSGAVIGLAGVGKSNLLGFLCHRPEALQQYLGSDSPPVFPIAVDLNNLPANDTSTFYRAVLRAFHEARELFEPELKELIRDLYLENRAAGDPFLSQSALRELLLKLQEEYARVVLVLDRFDWFCEQAEPAVTDTLRGLRDSFKDTLSYIVGMNQEVYYLSDPSSLGDLYGLLDSYVCWVGPMDRADARYLVEVEIGGGPHGIDEATFNRLLTLTGGHPGLLKSVCHWWRRKKDADITIETEDLLQSAAITFRLERIWRSLTLADQEILRRCGTGSTTVSADELDAQQPDAFVRLGKQGLLKASDIGWHISATLLATYVEQKEGPAPGRIWLEGQTNAPYQGRRPLEGLSPLEENLLRFLLRYPRVRHTHSALIDAVWPEEVSKEGVSTEALYQTVRGLRRKIEPLPSRPRYVVNWRGTPEGGYQFYPEGQPER